jgi:hypothetical protein
MGSEIGRIKKYREDVTRAKFLGITDVPIKLHNLDIYLNQVNDANEICRRLKFNRHVEYVAHPQLGKTGVAIAVGAELMYDAHIKGLSIQIVVPTLKAANQLKQQTKKRLEQAGLFYHGCNVLVAHLADLKNGNISVDPDADIVLIISDETHIGVRPDGLYDKWISKQCPGVYLDKNSDEWDDDGKFLFLGLTATPHYQLVQASFDIKYKSNRPKVMEIVFGKKPDSYCGVDDLLNNNRLTNNSAIIDVKNKDFTDNFQNVIDEILDRYSKYGPEHYVFRFQGKSASTFLDLLRSEGFKERYLNGADYNVREFNSKGDNGADPISELNGHLSSPASLMSFNLIRGSMSVGETLDSSEYIGLWFEGAKSNTDTLVQQIGRLCGHGKDKDNFLIYCNLDDTKAEIKTYINMINNQDVAEIYPTGYTKSGKEKHHTWFQPSGPEPWTKDGAIKLIEDKGLEIDYDIPEEIPVINLLSNMQLHLIKGRKFRDYSSRLLRQDYDIVQMKVPSLEDVHKKGNLTISLLERAKEENMSHEQVKDMCKSHNVDARNLYTGGSLKNKEHILEWIKCWENFYKELTGDLFDRNFVEANLLVFKCEYKEKKKGNPKDLQRGKNMIHR